MSWEVEYTNEFGEWWHALSADQQDVVVARVGCSWSTVPICPIPTPRNVRSSRHGNMRELRIQAAAKALRVFFAFDPRRTAILLIRWRQDRRRAFL